MADASSALPAFIAALVDSEISAYELQESDAIKALLHCLHATSPAARTSIRTAPVGHEQRQMLFSEWLGGPSSNDPNANRNRRQQLHDALQLTNGTDQLKYLLRLLHQVIGMVSEQQLQCCVCVWDNVGVHLYAMRE